MQETLAAAIIRHTGFNGTRPLWDPCAAPNAAGRSAHESRAQSAGYLRKNFGFFALETFDAAAWKRVKAAADLPSYRFPRGASRLRISTHPRCQRPRKPRATALSPVVKLQTADFRNMPDFHDGIVVAIRHTASA